MIIAIVAKYMAYIHMYIYKRIKCAGLQKAACRPLDSDRNGSVAKVSVEFALPLSFYLSIYIHVSKYM